MNAARSDETTSGPASVEPEGGPREWLFPILESAYSKLVPREQAEAEAAAAGEAPAAPAEGVEGFRSSLQPNRGETVLAAVPHDVWLDRLSEYKRRKAAAVRRAAPAVTAPPPAPVIPGERNWAPLGPSVVLNGQAHGLPPVGGRVSGIAVAPGGQRVYAASANGGVFRSDDRGVSWRSLMDAFDVDPTQFASTSLACGAIAIDPSDPNRVYVGTGEGDTYAIFRRRIISALPAYRGIGPIRSDDGGETWVSEATASTSPSLAGQAFFALAVDPTDRENVIGATSQGLYQRVMLPGGNPEWTQRRTGVHSSVVVASAPGGTRFWAAEWGKGVLQSSDGVTWSAVTTGFPASGVGRIALAVQPNNPDLVYAAVADTQGVLLGVFRLDSVSGPWKQIAGPPRVLPVRNGRSQGDYDLAIAVGPVDANLVYLGGSYFDDNEYYPASVWRCQIQASGSGYRMNSASIGVNAHADVHVLVHAPGDPDALWLGCDGGIFLNRAPRASGIFDSRNNGLACLCPNFFAQHPTDPNILLCGLQDNGTARTGGGPIWKHVNWGDGGYCLINWADPQQVLVFMNGNVLRATDGGQDHGSWTVTADAEEFGWASMTEPIVAPPYDPSQPATATLVALAAGQTVYLSTDFGATWASTVEIPTAAITFALAFASASRLYVGTAAGEVFRVDRSGSSWVVTRIDNAPAGPLGLAGLVSDIAVDWTDASTNSIYVAFGGIGDYRHVWHFDSTRWQARSGPAGPGANNLLDVEHNAITVDRQAPDHLYAGADIGIWHSPDRGQTWFPLPNGLPDAPVFDLQIHPTRRLLRAATHGRGLYEYPLDATP
jgi:hypothetical protein